MNPLRWVGGKHRLLSDLKPHLGDVGSHGLVEPFAGALTVGLSLPPGVLRGAADTCKPLLQFYSQLARDPEKVVRALASLPQDNRGAYYELRDEFRVLTSMKLDTPRQAALFLWLNRTGFNGLYRENSKGSFNVPAGKGRISLPSASDLKRASKALCGVQWFDGFEQAFELAQAEGLTVYADPPFRGTFSGYGAKQFDDADRMRLCHHAEDAAEDGCHVVLTDSWQDETRGLYQSADEAHELTVARTVSAGKRGRASVGVWVWRARR